MARSWYGESSAAPGWEIELGGSRLGWRKHIGSRLGGRNSGAAGCNELRSSRLRWWEFGGAILGFNKLIDYRLEQRKLAALGCGAWRSPKRSSAVPEPRGRRELDSSGLRQRELGDTRMRSELGGSRLIGKEHRLSMPGMRKLGCSRL